ncbi:hypothetical protein B0H16DRAFT_1541941 [Mycena metata]|uniref:F-box domain-containing protein n=1 Tax=Mycena metata TaxID=1033252 RepID=A0AAD7J150_9AGAR|nr:hypothetical protein B0H16DRAFT_1541941 [Mycena metata]
METSNSAPTGPHEKVAEKVTPATPTSLAVDRSRIAEIEAQKESVQSRLDAYTYPVLTLPAEIISEIFGHFLPVYPKRPPIIGLLSPFTLSQICRTWREIAHSTPRLWRAVDISPSSTSPLERQLHLAKLMLARSGSCLLSVSINSTDGQTPSVVEVLAPHRWEHLKLGVSLRNFDSIKTTLSSLQTLMLSRNGLDDQGPPIFLAAPLLRKVTLAGTFFRFFNDWRSMLIPWSQLLVLTIDDIEVYDCAFVLGSAPNLVFCRFRIETFDPSQNVISLAHCQSLETLVLRTGFPSPNWDLVAGLRNILTLPALRELQVAEIFLMPDPICIMDGEKPLERYREAWPSIEFYMGRQPPRFHNIEDTEELEWVHGYSSGGEQPDEDPHSR